jgi:hypothetical protein
MPDTPPDEASCKVLVSGQEPPLLESPVETLLASRANVEIVYPGTDVSADDIDLSIWKGCAKCLTP